MSKSCAICLESFKIEGIDKVIIPCCHVETSTTQFCFRCIEVLCQHHSSSSSSTTATTNNQLRGKCPRCNDYIEINANENTVQVAPPPPTPRGRCGMCRQHKDLTHHDGRFCSACAIGIANRLRYECDRCHRTQTIPHPMYRYQENEWSFGGATWACHQRCGDYTHWRIVEADIEKVPLEDAPEGWEIRHREIEEVRRLRRAEIRGQRGEVGQEQGHQAQARERQAQERQAQERQFTPMTKALIVTIAYVAIILYFSGITV